MKITNRLFVIVCAVVTLSAATLPFKGRIVPGDPTSSRQVRSRGMTLQMDFVITKEKSEAFEKMYTSTYVPAMKVQQGYLGSKMLRIFSENQAKGIEAEPTTYNYQIQIYFDSEENRKRWVASSQHQVAWPAATSLATSFKWRGYDVVGDDDQR